MENTKKTIGTVVLQIALGLLFIVSGIWTLQGGKGDEIVSAFHSIFSNDIAQICCLIFGIIEVVAGFFLLLRLFVSMNTNLDSVLIYIIMLCWIAAIIIINFIGKNGVMNNLNDGFLSFLNRFSRHLLILGAILKVKD